NGEYEAYIRKMEIKPGKKDPSKRYFVATVEVFSPDGRLITLTTWLALKHLFKHLYDACGQEEKLKQSKLSTKDCEGHNVMVKIGRQEGNEQYPNPKNVVQDFMKLKETKTTLTINGKAEEDFFNDPVPF